jgi:iron complex outermembrane receptor protein
MAPLGQPLPPNVKVRQEPEDFSMVKYSRKPLAALFGISTMLPGLSLVAAAQERATALEEVIITAQKREETLQDAPIAVSTLNGYQLEQRGITGLGDMVAGAMPSVKIQPFPNDPSTLIVSIRGIGPADAGQITKEPGVGIYQDNVYLGRSQGLGLDLADLERIEVLRGPQGTLYGRNVVGGAVNLISKKPAGEFGVKQNLNYNFDFAGVQSISHVDTDRYAGVAAKVSYLYADQDGWVENIGKGNQYHDYNEFEKQGARLALNWDNESNITADYVYDWADSDIMQNYFQLHDAGNLTVYNADSLAPPDLSLLQVPISNWGPDQFALVNNISSGAYLGQLSPFPNDEPPNKAVDKTRAALLVEPNKVQVDGHAFTLAWDINDSTMLKSISSYRELNQETHYNYGGVFGIGLATIAPFEQIDQDQWSQEFQLVGSALDDRIEYVAGAYYYNENVSEIQPPSGTVMELAFVPLVTSLADLAAPGAVAPFIVTRNGALVTLPVGVPIQPGATYPGRDVSSETESAALYGQARWQATDKFGATLGLRYTNDQKDSQRDYFGGVAVNQVADSNDDSVDPMLTLDYDWNEAVNSYVRYATGYKAGGVNLRSNTFAEYDPEEVESYELGVKSTFWDQRARLNTALWTSNYADYQIDFSDPADITVSETFNASNGNVELWGLETEFTVIPVDGLTLAFDYNFIQWSLDPQPNPLNPGGPPEVFDIPQAPKHSGTVSADYEFEPFSWGTLLLHADYIGQSSEDMRFSPKNNKRRDGRNLFNARVTLADLAIGSQPGALSASLWAKNLTDEDYVIYSITNDSVASVSDAWGEPRSVGVSLVYEY